MWNRHNVHKMFRNIYRNPKIRNWFRYKTFIHLFECKGFSIWGERDTQSFYADCFYIVSSQPNQHAASVVHKVVWPRPGLNLNFLVQRQELNSLLFSNTQILSPRFRAWYHSHLLVPIPIWDFYFDISEWHVNTYAHVCT